LLNMSARFFGGKLNLIRMKRRIAIIWHQQIKRVVLQREFVTA
jgi:hypothetical protein